MKVAVVNFLKGGWKYGEIDFSSNKENMSSWKIIYFIIIFIVDIFNLLIILLFILCNINFLFLICRPRLLLGKTQESVKSDIISSMQAWDQSRD